ncbi:MAG: hypothetical protein ACKVQA_16600 [Burkholderiales bacterium]
MQSATAETLGTSAGAPMVYRPVFSSDQGWTLSAPTNVNRSGEHALRVAMANSELLGFNTFSPTYLTGTHLSPATNPAQA